MKIKFCWRQIFEIFIIYKPSRGHVRSHTEFGPDRFYFLTFIGYKLIIEISILKISDSHRIHPLGFLIKVFKDLSKKWQEDGNKGVEAWGRLQELHAVLPTKDKNFRDDCREFILSVSFHSWFPSKLNLLIPFKNH